MAARFTEALVYCMAWSLIGPALGGGAGHATGYYASFGVMLALIGLAACLAVMYDRRRRSEQYAAWLFDRFSA